LQKLACPYAKEGHLYVKRSNGWSKEWFVLSEHTLHSYKSDKDYDPDTAIVLSLCHVRPSLKKRLLFEILTPSTCG